MRLRRFVATPAARICGVALLALAVDAGTAAAIDYRPARTCGACHGAIRREWEGSSMARSWTNPVFQAFLSDAKSALGDSVQGACIACHAPLASVTGDRNLESPVAREGVTCNFCHNVSDVDPSTKPASYTFDSTDPDLIRGPYDDSDAKGGHKTVGSKIHTRSDFCASCHSFTHPKSGVAIETTHQRWRTSSAAAKGKQCQDCHMPPAPGKASPLATVTRERVYAHTFAGAHSPAMLDSAATLRATLEGGRLKLTVRNAGAGHALPGGGNGMRAIDLVAVFYNAAGESLATTPVERYGTVFAGADGASPVPKWLAATVTRSNEIPPDSAVVAWCDPPSGAKRAEARLIYRFLLPEFAAALAARQVDLSAAEPRIMARASVKLP